eukprot:6476777-Amphidinium_carterae.1
MDLHRMQQDIDSSKERKNLQIALLMATDLHRGGWRHSVAEFLDIAYDDLLGPLRIHLLPCLQVLPTSHT